MVRDAPARGERARGPSAGNGGQRRAGDAPTRRSGDDTTIAVVVISCAALGLLTLFTGVWAFVFPSSFFEIIAPFEPYNRHFIHDAGAFSIGVSVALLLVAARQSGPIVGLGGYVASALLHLLSHAIDRDLGGNAGRDFPYLTFLAVAGLAALAAVLRGRSSDSAGNRNR